MKKLVGLGLLVLTILFTLVISYSPASFAADLIDRDALTEHDFDEINFKEASGNIISYSQYRNNIINTNQVISFNTAEELYQFSIDASFSNYNISQEDKEVLMSQSYTLGQDIDYGIMKSRRFIPIGYDFTKQSTLTSHTLKFNGVFDGRGFEISNLYLAGYESLVYEDIIVDLEIDISLSFYHAMFNYNEGTIKNFGLINPTIDLDYEHPDINNFANLVGENSGLIENVYVNESRTIQNGGMRILATRTSGQGRKTAAGIVHTNLANATFQNAYYTGRAVVNASYIHAVGTEALIYSNNGTIESLVYDNTLYLTEIELANIIVDVGEPNYGVGESTEVLYNNSSILNGDIWHYYPADRYPALWGLNYVNGYYEINDAKDFIYFNNLQRLNTVKNADAFRVSNYILTADINFNDIAPNSYKPSSVEFGGLFEGNNKQIINFSLNQGTILGSNYYMGLFAVVSGTIENVIMSNSNITPINYSSLYGQHFFIGNLVGRLDGGIIHNAYVEGNIDLGNENIGSFSIGGVVGEASGQVIKVYHEGNINLGSHNYTNEVINNKLNVGGIIGNSGSNKLILYNALNKANITTLSANNLNTSNNDQPKINVGGVIGFVENGFNRNHNLGLLTNEGIITIEDITDSSNVTIHLGGVIGYSSGASYDYNEFQGLFENKGNFIFNNTNSNIKAAGVLISNHNVLITYTQIFNTNKITVNSSNITAATLVYSIGNSNININHAKSSGTYEFRVNDKDLAMAIHNESQIIMNLRFIEVLTELFIGTSTNYVKHKVSNIEGKYTRVTLNNKTNYYNVVSGKINNYDELSGDYNTIGNITAFIEDSNPFFLSAITNVLESGYVAKDVINYSDFYITTKTNNNVYIAGLVNRNLSGDLHTQDNSKLPNATLGIINSVNSGNIDVFMNIENTTLGTGNIYVGGVTTMNGGPNGGSIQNVVNTGNIVARNNDTATVNFSTNANTGGIVLNYNAGIIVAGISAIITNGYSRIFDTSNSGNIVGISRMFVRSAGILGSSLVYELVNKTNNPNTYFINSSYFSDENSGPTNISQSVVSNGINYGKIQAITNTIGNYGGTTGNTPSRARPGINASAGGIIGYGLSTMNRMINHGEVSSTDVAGGIVGATTVWTGSNSSSNNVGVTIVNINTAINYGSVRMINNTNYNAIFNAKEATINQYYATNSTQIIPTNTDRWNNPGAKRGIGGVIGRLQRAQYNLMTAEGGSFDFVVNMNSTVDLIGRLDQYSISQSAHFFDFGTAKYYSAKQNDRTQAVFTGYYTSNVDLIELIDTEIRYSSTIRRTGSWFSYTYTKETTYTIISATETNRISNRNLVAGGTNYLEEITKSPTTVTEFTVFSQTTQNEWSTNGGSSNTDGYIAEVKETHDRYVVVESETQLSGNNPKPVPYISESAGTPNAQYVYGEDFIMRDDNTMINTGDGQEPITSYIYYAERDLLAPRFYNERTNGMYVLSTSSGSTFGSVLPRNLNINSFRTLKDKTIPLDSDYTSLESEASYNEIDIKLVSDYEELYQTMYNEKSELLEDDQVFEIKETNSGLLLQDPLIDFDSKTITFNLYADMVSNQTNLNFIITNALIPSNALITRLMHSGETNANYHNLITNYNNGNIASGNLAPNLLLSSKPSLSQTVSIGKFRSNSEALINDISFIDTYYTEYEIFINYIVNPISLPQYVAYQIDSATNWSTANLSNDRTITDKIGLRFRDTTQNIISPSFKIENFITLEYLNNDTYINVNNDYFSVSSTLKDNQRYFSAEVDFSEQLRNGLYRIGYKFYPDDEIKYVNIDYQKIINNRILNLRANTGTFYNEIPINNIHGDIKFGYDIPTGTYLLDSSNVIIDDNVAPYLNNKTYNLDFLEYFETSDFFDIESIEITDSYNSETGYKTYQIDFDLINGNDVTINLLENNIEPIYYKDGVRIPTGTTDITREAEQTIIELDFNFLNNVSNNLTIDSFATALDTIDHIDITYDDGRLRFAFNKELDPANYNTIIYLQYNNQQINVGSLNVEKQQGTSAYLSNIRFSAIAQETSYPDIYLSDETGNIINNPLYLPDVYFAGIDYAEADNNNIVNFRIDGQVSNIPLDDYTPLMTEYLPIGANIYRIEYINGVANRTSNLIANFTVDPITGNPPSEEDDVVITYVVVSENLENEVFYHITVTDVDYNVTLVFDILYQDSNGNFINVNDPNSPIKEDLIIISISNYEVSKDGIKVDIGPTPITNVNDYLKFDQINELRSRANMFYAPNILELSYRFGRNLSGFYQFKLELPNGYKYDIFNGFDIESNISNQDWINTNKLNLISDYTNPLNPSLELGYYYYINGSTKLRTSNFTIVITDADLKTDWGLTNKN